MVVRSCLAVTVSLLAAGAVSAQSADQLPDRPVPRAEVVAVVDHQFRAMDANHDGIVTQAEFERYRAAQRPASGGLAAFEHIGSHWFEHADAKGDGRVTLDEAEARPLHLFDIADANHDDVVSVAEAKTATMFMSFLK